jgi:hypothetical protein
MNSERIKEIQEETAYPNSVSVYQALLKVWNECEQDRVVKNCNIADVVFNEAEYCSKCSKSKRTKPNTIQPLCECDNSEVELVCDNCGCPNPKKTYDGHWCKICHNEM